MESLIITKILSDGEIPTDNETADPSTMKKFKDKYFTLCKNTQGERIINNTILQGQIQKYQTAITSYEGFRNDKIDSSEYTQFIADFDVLTNAFKNYDDK